MNRTIKDAIVRRFRHQAHDPLRSHLADFAQAYNFAKRLKTLKGLTPYEFICKAWQTQPEDSSSHRREVTRQSFPCCEPHRPATQPAAIVWSQVDHRFAQR
jgi:hypothetical protein